MKKQKARVSVQELALGLSVMVLCAIAAMLFLCVVWVLAADVESAIVLDSIYCENVEQGVWPDYKGIYAEQCGVRVAATDPAQP